MSEERYEDRTDSVAQKLELLHAAYGRGDHLLALSLLESMKDSVTLERQMQPPTVDPIVAADASMPVAGLPAAWATWAHGWLHCQQVRLQETAGIDRREPVDLPVAFAEDHMTDPCRELRVARVDEHGGLTEVVSQVYGEVRTAGQWRCQLVFEASVSANGEAYYLILFNNPWAERPRYETDLQTRGEGYGLDVENDHYIAHLSRQTGQLERLRYKGVHGLELSGTGDGHGEPPHIDWAHDYHADGAFQKFRVTNWERCPNYEVIRGPLCVQVRRWGFPHGAAHPLFAPSRMHMDLRYTFYAGQPWFVKDSRMQATKNFRINYLRDDEWLFKDAPFTHTVWMDRSGVLHEGAVQAGQEHDLWGVGFFHERSRASFIALFLDHSADNFDGMCHSGAPTLSYEYGGQLWSRWAARDQPEFRAGAVLKQRNAYLLGPYRTSADVEQTRRQMLVPLTAAPGVCDAAASSTPGALARHGETAETAPLKPAIWAALRQARDQQFMRSDANAVDMGYVYDVRVEGDVVRVLMTMPHRGRPKYGFVARPMREQLLALDGVRDVIIDCTWEPAWTVHRLTAAGRDTLGLPASGI